MRGKPAYQSVLRYREFVAQFLGIAESLRNEDRFQAGDRVGVLELQAQQAVG